MENYSPVPGEPALLEFAFSDPQTGQPVTRFETEHEKAMHTLVVSADLATFAHVHPELGCDGRFRLGINQPTADPDNQHARTAMPQAGPYLVFTEVKPEGQPVTESRFSLRAQGPAQPAELMVDAPQADGTIRKYFQADGSPGGFGDAYQATLSVDKMDHGPHKMLHLTVNLQHAHAMAPGMVHYMDVSDAQNWLGMAGHGVLISAAGETPEEKVFRHLHAGSHDHGRPPESPHNPTILSMGGDHDHPPHEPSPGAGPDFAFQLSGDQVPAPGLYKLWTQLKREGQILTLPFVFEVPA